MLKLTLRLVSTAPAVRLPLPGTMSKYVSAPDEPLGFRPTEARVLIGMVVVVMTLCRGESMAVQMNRSLRVA